MREISTWPVSRSHEKRPRDSQVESLGGLEADHKFKFGRSLNGQIGWLLALENTAGIITYLTDQIGPSGA